MASQPQTMVYTVDIGGGHVAEIEGPPGATPEQLQAAYQGSGGVDDTGNYKPVEQGAGQGEGNFVTLPDGSRSLRVDIEGNGKPYEPETNAAGAAGRGALDTAMLGYADEAGAGTEALLRGLIKGENVGDAYDTALQRNRGLMDADESHHNYARVAGQLIGGLAIPVGYEGIAARAAITAVKEGATLREARLIAQEAAGARSATARLAEQGAVTGGIYGSGSADGGPGERLLGAGVGAASGALAGGALGAAGDALAPRLAARAADRAASGNAASQGSRDIVEAADRQGIDLLPADVGGPTVKRLTAAAAQAPLSASPIINASQRVLQKGQEAVQRAAGNSATDAATAGEALRTGAQSYISRTGRIGGGLYDRAARRAGDAKIDPVNARAMLDDQISRLEAVPGGGQGLEEAKAMRDALTGSFSVQGIRDMRTELFVDPALRGSPMDRRMRQVIDAAAQDVEQGLRSQGKGDAAGAFKTADSFWRQRLETIDQVLEPVIGQPGKAKGGEAITKAVDTAAKGDVVKLQRLLSTLPGDERHTVTASFINRLGLATKGQQNAEGDAFSLGTFLTSWSQLSPRARKVLFTPEQHAALSDVATVADGVKNASKYSNFSNTSGGIWGNLGILAGSATAAPTAAAAGLGAQLIGGRLLASPKFARWLARAPKTSMSQEAYIDRLSRIAKAEPAIANDVLSLQSRLLEAARGSRPASAEQERGGSQPVQP